MWIAPWPICDDRQAIERLLRNTGFEAAGFADYLAGAGRREHDRIREDAERMGVLGVPSYVVGEELFWGAERIPRVRELLRRR